MGDVILHVRLSTEFARYRQLRDRGWKVKWVGEGKVCMEEPGAATGKCPRGDVWWALYGSYGRMCPDCSDWCEGRKDRSITCD